MKTMNKVQLKQLRVKNFKGFKNKTFDFPGKEINFLGANGTGKTSIFDAIIWLLFGKDHLDQTDFAIKPQDKDGNIIHKLETEVEAVYLINDKETTIKRVLKEKWVKKKGALKPVFTGNETKYYWNEVPKKQSEYKVLVNQILDENVFKLITDPTAFGNLHWEKARNILTDIVGEVSDEDVAKDSNEFKELLEQINNKGLKGYKDELKSKRKRLNDDIKEIPTRIDEVHNNKPEEIDVDAVKSKKSIIEKEISKIEGDIQDRSKAQEKEFKVREELSEELLNLKNLRNQIIYGIEERVKSSEDGLETEIEKLKTQSSSYEIQIKDLTSKISQYKDELFDNKGAVKDNKALIDKKREEWESQNAKELKFNEEDFNCPTCKRPLDKEDVESEKQKMLDDFRTDKNDSLNLIVNQGNKLVKDNTSLEERNKILSDLIKEAREKLQKQTNERSKVDAEIGKIQAKIELKTPVEELIQTEKGNNKDLTEINTKIIDQEEKVNNRPGYDISDLQDKLKTEKENLEALKDELKSVDEIKKADDRIASLEEEENKLAQQIADLEKLEFVVENFENKKYTALEEKVNKKFKLVKFKMFKKLVNGDLDSTCIPMVDGIPFNKGLNNAMRINAGIDIINVLSEHYKVSAPIVIDERESVTEIIETQAQVINLIVSKEHKTLTAK